MTSVLFIQSVLWTLCATALGVSYWNYSRYAEARLDPEKSKRNLQIAIHARSDSGIGEAEFSKIESAHYRPYQTRFRAALLVGLSFMAAGLAHLFA
ncbi:hypothetical protein [Pseudomonas sp. DP16D-R1]|uniref:hypothetical protein n=1 Tax=Pseudomonas sp. DP16D-R1 TaxID=2075551 RepID=UPI000CD202C0|nr:hypothetical protein [Pseudomonas sp. DP16D-R1]POA78679.1 hypothetical protein C1890_10120 [Pseudomonas sp. DP16D-R1]